MNQLLAAYTPSFHPADRCLVPQRTCQVYWQWIASTKLSEESPFVDAVKRIAIFVPLLFITAVSYAIGFIAAGAKVCFPRNVQPLTEIDAKSAREEALGKIGAFCWKNQATVLTAAITSDGHAFLFGHLGDTSGPSRRVFFAHRQDPKITEKGEETRNWGIQNSPEGDPILHVRTPRFQLSLCAFPKQGSHPSQQVNESPLEQVTTDAAVQVAYEKASENLTLIFTEAAIVRLIASYALKPRFGIQSILHDSTQGAVTLGQLFRKNSDSVPYANVFVHGATVYAGKDKELVPTWKLKDPQSRAEFCREVRGVIQLTVETENFGVYYIDLQTYNSESRQVKAYRFLRPATPLTPQQMVSLFGGQPKNPEAPYVSHIGLVARLGLAHVINEDRSHRYFLFSQDQWSERPPEEHLHLSWCLKGETVISWGEAQNQSPYRELLHPASAH